MTDRKAQQVTAVLRYVGWTYFVEKFVQCSTSALRMNSNAKNLPQRKALNCEVQALKTTPKQIEILWMKILQKLY